MACLGEEANDEGGQMTRRSRLAEDEIELADTVMHLKHSVQKIQTQIAHLQEIVEDLRAAKAEKIPLADWVDEWMYIGGAKNPAVPFLEYLHNVRAEGALRNAQHQTNALRAVTTRDLLALSHDRALLWKNFGKVALASVVRALDRAGVQWPVKGRTS